MGSSGNKVDKRLAVEADNGKIQQTPIRRN